MTKGPKRRQDAVISKKTASWVEEVRNKALRADLERAMATYDTVEDKAHGRPHVENVIRAANLLNQQFRLPQDRVTASAVLHDIGNPIDRKQHHIIGAQLAPQYLGAMNPRSRASVIHAIREHRYSKGNPKTQLAKMINDADTMSDFTTEDDPDYFFRRLVQYRKSKGMPAEEVYDEALNYGRPWLQRALNGGLRTQQALDTFRPHVERALKNTESPEAFREFLQPMVEQEYGKTAALATRPRAELFARKDGKILSGLFPQQGIGVYGGGIDPGEDPAEAARREFLEEAGYNVENVRPIDVPAFRQRWLKAHSSPKQLRRKEEFPGGTLTRAYVGDIVGDKQGLGEDHSSWLKDVQFRPVDELLDIQRRALSVGTPPERRLRDYRMRVLEALQAMQEKTSASKEFAPGISKARKIDAIPTIKNKAWTLSIQQHDAKKAGKHYDVRLVDPKSQKAHSFAVPRGRLPDKGDRMLLAIQQPTHTADYALNFEGKIPAGTYGAGQVKIKLQEPVNVVKANADRLHFERPNGRGYVLFRTQGNNWGFKQKKT